MNHRRVLYKSFAVVSLGATVKPAACTIALYHHKAKQNLEQGAQNIPLLPSPTGDHSPTADLHHTMARWGAWKKVYRSNFVYQCQRGPQVALLRVLQSITGYFADSLLQNKNCQSTMSPICTVSETRTNGYIIQIKVREWATVPQGIQDFSLLGNKNKICTRYTGLRDEHWHQPFLWCVFTQLAALKFGSEFDNILPQQMALSSLQFVFKWIEMKDANKNKYPVYWMGGWIFKHK